MACSFLELLEESCLLKEESHMTVEGCLAVVKGQHFPPEIVKQNVRFRPFAFALCFEIDSVVGVDFIFGRCPPSTRYQ